MKIPGSLAASVLLLAGCPSDDGTSLGSGANEQDDDFNTYDDDDLPAGSCRDTATDTDPCDTEGTTIGATASDAADNTCMVSDDCDGGTCAAEFFEGTLERGPLVCQFSCVPLVDDTRWCADDAACCDEGARCVGRGYCVLEGAEGTTGP